MVPYERIIKLDEKSVKCVLFGVSKESKAYRLYNSETKKIVISRDVQFDESKGWNWEEVAEDIELTWDDMSTGRVVENVVAKQNEEEEDGEEENGENAEEVEPSQAESTVQATTKRTRQAPVWMRDYVSGNAHFVVSKKGEDMVAMLITAKDPVYFEEAVQEDVWRKAMEA